MFKKSALFGTCSYDATQHSRSRNRNTRLSAVDGERDKVGGVGGR